MLIKKDKNEELEKILATKKVDEQAKNLIQGILYKIEIAYKDYKTVKRKKQTEEKYVKELIENIDKKCDKISIVKLTQKVANEEIQRELEKNKFYVEEEIISYPIEEKILYAIEKKSRHNKILNSRYKEIAVAISNIINTGKNIDRVEVLRDFNGWSWTTINKEIENIEANLIYQTLQILLGEEFLDNWCKDKDGIIDYLEQLEEEISDKYGKDLAIKQKELLIKIAILNTANYNNRYLNELKEKEQNIEKKISEFEDTKRKIEELTECKKQLIKELSHIDKILGQNTRLKEEYEKVNADVSFNAKIFNIKTFKKQFEDKKQHILEQIEQVNYMLNPVNYLKEKNRLLQEKEKLQIIEMDESQQEKLDIEFIKIFLKCFKNIIKNTKDEEEIVKLIYQLRYFLLLPINEKKCVKDIEEIKDIIVDVEEQITKVAIRKKVIANVPKDIMSNVFRTRIISLEDIYYKISLQGKKYYAQIFDENICEEKFEIKKLEDVKTNKKKKIFI